MTNDQHEHEIGEALRRLGAASDVPPLDTARERALLAAFDAYWAGPRPSGRRVWMTAAATLTAIVVTLDWLAVTRAPRLDLATSNPDGSDPAVDMTGFVPWPGADAWPPLESGRVMRVDLPVAALPALGLFPPTAAASVVQADLVVGQDGFARAVRLVQ